MIAGYQYYIVSRIYNKIIKEKTAAILDFQLSNQTFEFIIIIHARFELNHFIRALSLRRIHILNFIYFNTEM